METTTERRRRATVKDVALEAGVSRGTVSRVLNGQPYVSDEAREAIEAALSEEDYQLSFLIADTPRDVERLARYLSGGLIDGVIIVSARVGDPITRAVRDLGLPAAFVGHPRDIGDAPYVAIDNRGAAREITAGSPTPGARRSG